MADELNIAGEYISLARKFEAELEKTLGKKLPINVDGAIAALLCEMDFDVNFANAFFMIARIPGLVAHIYEEKTRYKLSDSCLSIEFKNTMALNGDMIQTFSNLSDGSIITLFDKTPFPEQKDDVVCPHFVELKWANGCDFDCAWCYLKGTFRFQPTETGESILPHKSRRSSFIFEL